MFKANRKDETLNVSITIALRYSRKEKELGIFDGKQSEQYMLGLWVVSFGL